MHLKILRGTITTLTLLLILACYTLHVEGSTNNTVNDEDGSIVWGELAPDKPYKTVDYEADDGGLDPYYALAHSFIDSSLPAELPVDTFKGIMDGTTSIGDVWQELAKEFLGYSICIVIGILFIFIFPIVGCCFCLCRCCGNCGGKMHQDQGPHGKCKRIGFSIALSILSLFVITGAACTFVTSDQFHKNFDGLNSSVGEAIDDFNTFIDNIDSQFGQLGNDNFNFLSGVLNNYVSNASSQVSERIIKAINDQVDLKPDLDAIDAEREKALAEVQKLSNDADDLSTQKAAIVASGNPALSAALRGVVLTPIKTSIDSFQANVETDVFKKMSSDIETKIRIQVEAKTGSIDVDTKLRDIHEDQISPMLDQVSSLRDSLNEDADDYQDTVVDMVDFVKVYDQYRWYAGLGLACLLILISLIMLVGVGMGVFCGSVKTPPSARGGASNCGGILLMVSVVLIFIFGALLMLLTTLIYMAGALTERYVCQSLDDFSKVEKYSSTLDLGIPDLNNFTFTLNNETIAVSVSHLMDGCQEGKTLYEVLGLQGVVDHALDKINDFKATSLNDINTIDASATANLVDTNTLNVGNEISALQASVSSLNTVGSTIDTLKSQLEGLPGASTNPDLQNMISTLSRMKTTTTNLHSTAQNIVNLTNPLPGKINSTKSSLGDTTKMTALIGNVTQGFTDTIFGFVDSYVSDMKTKMAHDIAKCTPFYSISHAVFGEAFCHGIVDPLNGFWLALGWSLFFFMPSLILAVKLAKHFRTMDTVDAYDDAPTSNGELLPMSEPSAPPMKQPIFPPISGNKVSPM